MRIDKNSTKGHRNKVSLKLLAFFIGIGLFGLLLMNLKPSEIIEISTSVRVCEGKRVINHSSTYQDMSLETALEIGKESDCILYGKLTSKEANCNASAGQWWIPLEETSPKRGCVRSCVVDIFDRTTEINYQCGFNESF